MEQRAHVGIRFHVESQIKAFARRRPAIATRLVWTPGCFSDKGAGSSIVRANPDRPHCAAADPVGTMWPVIVDQQRFRPDTCVRMRADVARCALSQRSSARRRDRRRDPMVASLRNALGMLFVDLVYLPKPLRGQGLGSRMMGVVEQEAARRGCRSGALITTSFQAPGFCARLGWHELARLPCDPPGTFRVTRPCIPHGQPDRPTQAEGPRQIPDAEPPGLFEVHSTKARSPPVSPHSGRQIPPWSPFG